MMKTVFLSYARADGSQAAARLRAELQQAGFAVWRDIGDMRGGDDWKEQLRGALRQVDAVLVLLTPGSVVSPTVAIEWEVALALEKRVIPLLIAPCTLPAELARRQYHDFSKPKRRTTAFAALVRDLNELKSAPAAQQPKRQTGGSQYTIFNAKNSAIGDGVQTINYGSAGDDEEE